MQNNSANFLQTQYPRDPQEQKESRKVILFLGLALVFLITSAVAGGLLFASSAGFKPGAIIAKIRSLTLSREKQLQGEKQDRVNVLLLGMGGAGHDGATLTDTIIFASVRPSDKQVGLLSIPRDLQVNIQGYGWRRINTVNAFAEQKDPGSGGQSAAQMVSQILDQQIPYYLRLDFKAFEQIINAMDGIEVDVDQSFYDPFYPDDDFGYAPVFFEKGRQKMNGERALKFVRSRHGTNGEGNDFARARRQQKVLLALKDRVLSFDVLLRPKRIKTIMESLNKHIQTNITLWEGMRLAKLISNTEKENIVSRVLDASPEGVLVERNHNGAFVLEPKGGDWGAVRAIAAGIFDQSAPVVLSKPLPAPLPAVEIQNGTLITGLAARTAEQLEKLGFNVLSIGNGSLRDVEKTIAYDLTGGKRKQDFEKLKNELAAIDGGSEPNYILSKSKLDFLVILGNEKK